MYLSWTSPTDLPAQRKILMLLVAVRTQNLFDGAIQNNSKETIKSVVRKKNALYSYVAIPFGI